MVIDKFVDIEGGEKVKNVRVIDLPVDRHIRWEPWEQVCPVNNGVNVNDAHVAPSLASGFRLYNPQAGTSVWFTAR